MGAAMGQDPDILGEVCGWVMSAAKKPVWAKDERPTLRASKIPPARHWMRAAKAWQPSTLSVA